jgi:hypothetical protein
MDINLHLCLITNLRKLRTSPTSFGTGAFLIAATFFGSGDIPCAPKI